MVELEMPRQEIEDRHELIQRDEEAEHAARAAEGKRCLLGLALYRRRNYGTWIFPRSQLHCTLCSLN